MLTMLRHLRVASISVCVAAAALAVAPSALAGSVDDAKPAASKKMPPDERDENERENVKASADAVADAMGVSQEAVDQTVHAAKAAARYSGDASAVKPVEKVLGGMSKTAAGVEAAAGAVAGYQDGGIRGAVIGGGQEVIDSTASGLIEKAGGVIGSAAGPIGKVAGEWVGSAAASTGLYIRDNTAPGHKAQDLVYEGIKIVKPDADCALFGVCTTVSTTVPASAVEPPKQTRGTSTLGATGSTRNSSCDLFGECGSAPAKPSTQLSKPRSGDQGASSTLVSAKQKASLGAALRDAGVIERRPQSTNVSSGAALSAELTAWDRQQEEIRVANELAAKRRAEEERQRAIDEQNRVEAERVAQAERRDEMRRRTAALREKRLAREAAMGYGSSASSGWNAAYPPTFGQAYPTSGYPAPPTYLGPGSSAVGDSGYQPTYGYNPSSQYLSPPYHVGGYSAPAASGNCNAQLRRFDLDDFYAQLAACNGESNYGPTLPSSSTSSTGYDPYVPSSGYLSPYPSTYSGSYSVPASSPSWSTSASSSSVGSVKPVGCSGTNCEASH